MSNVTVKFDKRRVSDLLCSAFEGGSNYWYVIEGYVTPPTPERIADPDGQTLYRHLDFPLSDGGAAIVSVIRGLREPGQKPVRLDIPTLQKGLQVMAEKYPRHFGNWLSENDDAETGDVFLQCCMFGEIVYG